MGLLVLALSLRLKRNTLLADFAYVPAALEQFD